MRQDYEALSFSSKGGKNSLLGRSQMNFGTNSRARNSNLYNSIDMQNMTHAGEQGKSNFFNNSNLADESNNNIPTLMKNGSALADAKVAALTQQKWAVLNDEPLKLPDINKSMDTNIGLHQEVGNAP